MRKNILVIYYSQSGQLKEITSNLTQPLSENNFDVDFYQIQPEVDYDFPWKPKEFYGAFPESFKQIPIAINPPPMAILEKEYDLVIFAYQIWFLTPSIPANSFLKSEYAKQLLNNKKVITVIGCRNMWAKAQQKTKVLIEEAGGELVGNIAFVDKHLNHISVITIVHWVMGGKKTRKFGVFPKPGVSDEDINGASKFGELILQVDQENRYETLQDGIIKLGGADLRSFIVFMDETANKMFDKWSSLILRKKEKRALFLSFFKAYLLIAIWLVSPIVYIVFLLTYPLRMKKIKAKKIYYSGVA